MNEEVFRPVDETKQETGKEIRFGAGYGEGDALDHYGIDNDVKNPEDYPIEDDERKAEREDLEGKREELEDGFYDGVQDAHDKGASRKKRKAARVLDLVRKKINDAVQGCAVKENSDEELFEHGEIITDYFLTPNFTFCPSISTSSWASLSKSPPS